MRVSWNEEAKDVDNNNRAISNLCYYLEVAARAVLKCLGLDHESSSVISKTEQGGYLLTTNLLAIRRTKGKTPVKPPIDQGQGPRHN